MSYYSSDAIHSTDINDDYYLYQDRSLHSALIVEKREQLATLPQESDTLELEWEKTFRTPHYILKLKEKALAGFLRFSNFRSISWQVFLSVLPDASDQWDAAASMSRVQYSELKKHYVVDPHATEDLSLSVNNPLSQEEHSPWAQFFQDNELRNVIMQDVKRTYPGELMFEQPEVRDIMLNILFIYAREHPDISYKQGMHELLAPLVFVFYTEYTLVKDVAAPGSHPMKDLICLEYLEHDLYWCYESLMKLTKAYYATDPIKNNESESTADAQTKLFKSQPAAPSTYIVQNLEELQSVTLKRHDPELQQHLSKLCIQPQLYGLRWMRLLFGREFQLKDMLVIWDALFAAQDFAGMVEYMCIAMLLYIRDALLCNDHTGCLTLLMRYPETPQVQFFVQRALYLRNPSHYECPPNWQYRQNTRTRLISNGRLEQGERRATQRLPSTSSATLPERRRTLDQSESKKISPAVSSTSIRVAGESGELAERRRVAAYCSSRMDTLIEELQDTVCQLEAAPPQEDQLMVALAGLKQVRDILKGNVSLGCVLGGSETPSLKSEPIEDKSETEVEEVPEEPQAMPPQPRPPEIPPKPRLPKISPPAVQPPLPPADLETLNLFKDLTLSAPVPSKRKKSDDFSNSKSQDFFDPLSSALVEGKEDLETFLKN